MDASAVAKALAVNVQYQVEPWLWRICYLRNFCRCLFLLKGLPYHKLRFIFAETTRKEREDKSRKKEAVCKE